MLKADLELSEKLVQIITKYDLSEAEMAEIYAKKALWWIGRVVVDEWEQKRKKRR